MKYFIFDLGGVLVKPMKIEKIYTNFSWKITYEEFKNKFTVSDEAINLHKGLITTKEYFSFLKQFIREDISFSDFLEVYRKSKRGIYDEVQKIIIQLKESEYKVCLLSNLRKLDFDIYQENYDTTIFDNLFLSYELNLLKPSKEIYEYVIKYLDVSPDQIYFFDDSSNNVEAAKECGINAYQVTGENICELFSSKLNNI